jgi:hypothetical protein
MSFWPRFILRILLIAFILPILAISSSDAVVGVPDPDNSECDPCLVISPLGTFCFSVTVRDVMGAPMPGTTVTIDLCNCPDVLLCFPLPSDGYVIVGGGCVVSAITDASGVAIFCIRGGGVCNGEDIEVSANGIPLKTLGSVASPDQNGDLEVSDPEDTAFFQAKFGSSDPTADLNCDGVVGLPDITQEFTPRIGESCDGPTPNLGSTWGKVKSFYR